MNSFTLELADSGQTQIFEHITQFVGADNSGSFGIQAKHAPLVAVLRYGLARFQKEGGAWSYVALPSAVLQFTGNHLSVTAVQCFLGDDRDRLVKQLTEAMEAEDSDIHNARATLAQIEQSLMRRLTQLGKAGEEVWLS